MQIRILLLAGKLSLISLGLLAQNYINVQGIVTDRHGKGLGFVNISVLSTGTGTTSSTDGSFSMRLPSGQSHRLLFSCLGYLPYYDSVSGLPGTNINIYPQLETDIKNIREVKVSGNYDRSSTLVPIDIRTLDLLPNTSGGIEGLLKTLGVSSNNELSSQYSVRGGNFDENLVYVNDIEIYRPFLIRSGQQEGLSFINPDLVSGIKFSAGGFDASYGDKLSSVLDISYKRPTSTGGSVSASLLGGSAHFEGLTKNRKLSYISGIRYKTTQYLLQSMDTKGEYKPTFVDFQSLINWNIHSKFDISFLGNFARNQYTFIPETRETDFGTIKNSYRLKIYYDGNELDRYDTWMGALTFHYHPTEELSLKLIGSSYVSFESETFDIQGQYLINELDIRIGSETAGDSIANIGVGTFLDHARNFLDVQVNNLSHIGSYALGNNKIKWGIRIQQERIDDHLSEWKMIDSAGYSLPYDPEKVQLYEVIKSKNFISSNRITGFFQNSLRFALPESEIILTGGIRVHYWDFNQQLLINPRIVAALDPSWERDFQFRIAAGIYDQPAFYKEFRDPSGKLNKNIRSQRSAHFVSGTDYYFNAWDRPFKFTTELYYKHLWDLIPYKIDNVRVRYSAKNNASGYATGIDFKINGQFVADAESWASLSFMRTMEDIQGDYYVKKTDAGPLRIEPGYYPRPTDQLMNFGLYFQDYLPNNPSYRVSLYFLYGSRLPFSAPFSKRYDEVYRMPSYKRVDIGFIKVFKSADEISTHGIFKTFQHVLLSAEIFNLFGVNNTISYLWVKTVSNTQDVPGMFAVPNYLTSRRLNVKLSLKF